MGVYNMDLEKYITVGQLNKYIKSVIDNNSHLQNVYLKGEISNFKAHSRGHWYFTLKDETSRINAIMFSFNASKIKFVPVDGMKVLVNGKISVYEASGAYQIYVTELMSDGVGNLHIAFEQLKKKLESEGLFDKKYKKRVPKIPKKIGIVTAPTGAAIKDIISTIKRRFPICETILFPSLVQGDLAAASIVKQIKKAQEYDIDTLIVGRGGGSIEDLWAFNEEEVARAIFECKIPVISAVGHEIDFTISDFVADLRAPTPTGAAEMAVPNFKDILNYISQVNIRLNEALNKKIEYLNLQLSKLKNSYILKNPISMYEMKEQKLDIIIDKLNNNIVNKLEICRTKFEQLKNNYTLNNPKNIYEIKEKKLKDIINLLSNKTNNIVQSYKIKLASYDINRINKIALNYVNVNDTKINNIIEKLEVLNPLNSLKRGYAIVKKNNKTINNIKKIKTDDIIDIQINGGIINSKVIKIEELNNN